MPPTKWGRLRPDFTRYRLKAPPEALTAGHAMGFGEGNFQALCDSIELDQKKTGIQ